MRVSFPKLALAAIDAAIVALAIFIAIVLYYNGALPEGSWDALQIVLPVTMGMVILFNAIFGLYNRVWQYVGFETACAIGASVTAALVLSALLNRYITIPFPIMAWYTAWLFALFAIAGTRFAWRFMRPSTSPAGGGENGDRASKLPRVLIYGAGGRGVQLVQMLDHQATPSRNIVGFLDDDPSKRHLHVGDYRVLGTGQELQEIARRHKVDEVIIAMEDQKRSELHETLLSCRWAGVKATIMPSLLEVMHGQHLRPREIDVEDLLGREAPVTRVELHENYIKGKTVLVTGAGGSIGSELSRLICRHNPAHLILLGRGENRIHWIYLQLKTRHPELKITPVVRNITVTSAIERVFRELKPDIVFHAAAHKHVYLMETVPAEAVRNNVLATNELARIASDNGVERFIFISTDKAVAPTSVMGATKRACELLLVNRDHRVTKFICVRFGNVLGSEGSVLEIFRRQWKAGEPLTVTHQDATRYFMSIPEASFLVMQAGALGGHGDLFLLDMGEPVRISKLAEEFILLNGGNPHEPGAIRLTGLREGEKLHEALVYAEEDLQETINPHVMRACNTGAVMAEDAIASYVAALERAVAADDDAEVLRVLNEFTGGTLLSPSNRTSKAM